MVEFNPDENDSFAVDQDYDPKGLLCRLLEIAVWIWPCDH